MTSGIFGQSESGFKPLEILLILVFRISHFDDADEDEHEDEARRIHFVKKQSSRRSKWRFPISLTWVKAARRRRWHLLAIKSPTV